MTCFEKKYIKSHGVTLFSACAVMRYWVDLYPEETQELITSGVDLMMRTTMKLLGKDDGRMTLASKV
jgi:hypothetical protein